MDSALVSRSDVAVVLAVFVVFLSLVDNFGMVGYRPISMVFDRPMDVKPLEATTNSYILISCTR